MMMNLLCFVVVLFGQDKEPKGTILSQKEIADFVDKVMGQVYLPDREGVRRVRARMKGDFLNDRFPDAAKCEIYVLWTKEKGTTLEVFRDGNTVDEKLFARISEVLHESAALMLSPLSFRLDEALKGGAKAEGKKTGQEYRLTVKDAILPGVPGKCTLSYRFSSEAEPRGFSYVTEIDGVAAYGESLGWVSDRFRNKSISKSSSYRLTVGERTFTWLSEYTYAKVKGHLFPSRIQVKGDSRVTSLMFTEHEVTEE